MATHQYFFGLVGILGAISCNSTTDEGDQEATGNGGTTGTNTYLTSSGGVTATATATGRGGATATTTTTIVGSGGTTTTTTTINPNRPLSDAEADAITASACNAWAIEPEASAGSKLELIIDVSSSMNSRAPGTNRTKWEETRDALVEAVPGLATGGGLPANTSVGLLFYPNMRNETVSRTPTDPSVCIDTSSEVPMAILGGN